MLNLTVNGLAARLNVEYPVASALVKLMESQGVAKKVGKQPTKTGKGKPADIYLLPEKFELVIGVADESPSDESVDELIAADKAA